MRVRRSLLSFGTMVLYTGVTMVVGLWSTPLLQLWLGVKSFGGLRVINSAYNYLGLLELGLGGALAPLLARAVGTGDRQAMGATVAAGFRDYLRVTVLTVAMGLVLTPVIPWFARDLTGAQVDDLRRAWLVGLTASLSLALLPMRWVIEARQLGYVTNLLLTLQSLVVTAIALTLARAGWGITGQSLALVTGTLGMNLAMVAVVHRSHPGLIRDAMTAPPDPAIHRAVRRLSLPTLLIHLSGRVSYLTDELVVGALINTSNVTALFNTQRLAILGQTMLQSAGNAVWAGLAELFARGDRETFNRRLVELSRLLGVLCAAGMGPAIAYNRAFVTRWIGQRNPAFVYGGDAVIVVTAINVYFLAQMSLWTWCFSGTGKIRRVVPIAVVGAAVNLAASVLLTLRLGLVGPLLGTTVAVVPVALWALPVRLKGDFGTPLGPLFWAVSGPMLWGVVTIPAFWFLARWHAPTTYPGLALGMGLTGLASLLAGAALLLTPDERRHWQQRLRSLRT
jgi:O-antigen/teichoic acid export membrane protein